MWFFIFLNVPRVLSPVFPQLVGPRDGCRPLSAAALPHPVSVEIPPGQGFSSFDVQGLVKIKTQWFPAGPEVLHF